MSGKEKQCNKCGEIKPLEKFFKDKNRKDGYQPVCKECTKAANTGRASKPGPAKGSKNKKSIANLQHVGCTDPVQRRKRMEIASRIYLRTFGHKKAERKICEALDITPQMARRYIKAVKKQWAIENKSFTSEENKQRIIARLQEVYESCMENKDHRAASDVLKKIAQFQGVDPAIKIDVDHKVQPTLPQYNIENMTLEEAKEFRRLLEKATTDNSKQLGKPIEVESKDITPKKK